MKARLIYAFLGLSLVTLPATSQSTRRWSPQEDGSITWNDQAEYINPYFPFTGYAYGNASALNSFRHFARFMNDEWKPIPSSIIAEGLDIWNGAGDRGDAAMIAYGASRFALAGGDRQQAEPSGRSSSGVWNTVTAS